jgi:hypothetical protein
MIEMVVLKGISCYPMICQATRTNEIMKNI